MPAFVVRAKVDNRFVSRHYTTSTPKQAAKRAKKAGIGRIISVKKVGVSDVIGTIESMNLKDIIGITHKEFDPKVGIVYEDTSISDIVYSGRKPKRNQRRFYKKKKDTYRE